ncbi:sigma-70 family RNA polymerase sigma factor [Cellulomonas sp. T2.31MG-18]|uniref:sigma-70 family RNA polymerase sigma factor n=1 Tax=Cellulomonas sp. T2.31MG-18 TaxID=3157619 RepID=UPI00366F94DA
MAGVGSDLRSDADLIAASRTRDAAAFGALYERHAGAALVVARQHTDSAADAEDVVADAFTAVWGALQRGSGPTEAFRAYLFTVVRRVAAVRRDAGRRTQATDDVAVLEAGALPEADAAEPALAGLERGLVARAFASLPERWQAVLWHSEVEGLQPAQIAPLLGLTANSTAALAYRAREGLRQAYLQQHLNEPLSEACRAVSGKLGGYVRGGLGARDTKAVEAHLDECGRCRGLVLELGDVSHGMRGVVAPLVLGLAGLGALGHALPIGGGLAAGVASLTAGPTGAAAGGGAGAGAGAGGAAGAGAGGAAGGAAAGELAGAGATEGMGAAGAATAGALTTGAAGVGGALAGVGGLLAGIPTALVAGIAAVVVVAAGVVGAVQLLSSDSSGKGAAVSTTTASPSTGTTGSTGSGGVSDGSAAGSTPAASSDPTSSAAAGTGTGIADLVAGSSGTSTTSGGSSTSSTASSGDSGTSGTTDPGTGPTQTSPAPAPTPPLLSVQGPAGFTLTAGTTGTLAVDVVNTGGSPATGLVATVTLPAGVSLAGVDTGALSPVTGRFAPLAAVGWLCGTAGGAVECNLQQLPGQTQLRLTLTVQVDEGYDAGDGSLAWSVSGAGLTTASQSVPLHVAPSPAHLVAAGAVPDLWLVTGRTAQVAVPLRNAGGTATTAAAPAVVDVVLPSGVAYSSVAAPWTCTRTPAGGGTTAVHCTDPSLGARAGTTLWLALQGSQPGTGTVSMQLGPTGGHPAGVLSFGCVVVTPSNATPTPTLTTTGSLL